MSNVIWIMQSDRDDFKLLSADIRRLVIASERFGKIRRYEDGQVELNL